jgi:hypothetical protein
MSWHPGWRSNRLHRRHAVHHFRTNITSIHWSRWIWGHIVLRLGYTAGTVCPQQHCINFGTQIVDVVDETSETETSSSNYSSTCDAIPRSEISKFLSYFQMNILHD